MKKSNSLLSKALSEADTIRAGALKNAQDVLFEAFKPHIKNLYKNTLREQVLREQELKDTKSSLPNDYDQDDKEADLPNPDKSMEKDGEGPKVLEDDEIENPDEDAKEGYEEDDEDEAIEVEPDNLANTADEGEDEPIEDDKIGEQEEVPGEDENQFEFEDEDEATQGEFGFNEAEDEEEPVEEMAEGEEDEDEFKMEGEDEEIPEEPVSEEDIEVVPDEDETEGEDVETSKPEEFKTAANETIHFRNIAKKYKNENKILVNGINKLRSKIQEINLFNAKVACANRVITTRGLGEKQKVKILEAFDRCKSVREVNLTYANFKNLLKSVQQKKVVSPSSRMNEGKLRKTLKQVSKINTQRANTGLISEQKQKMLKLAGIIR